VKKRLTIGIGNSLRTLASAAFQIGWCVQLGAVTVLGATSASGATPPSVQSKSELLHVLVGHTFFLDTEFRLKRVYISNPAVLTSMTYSPNQLLITAKSAGVSSLVIWDTFGRSTVYTVSADIDADGLRQALLLALPHDHLEVSVLQDHIGISGTVTTQAAVDTAVKLAQLYAKDVANSMTIKPAPVKQVELKVRFIEVDRVKLNQFGFNFLSLGKNVASTSTQQFSSFSNISSSAGSASATIANPLNLLLYNQGLNVGAALQDLEQKQVVQILAEPTITAISGEAASFLSGGEFPYPVVQGGSGGYASVSVSFRPFGVKLDFTPTVSPEGTIRLKVAPEVSALDYTNQLVISGYSIPALSTRRAQTDVELQSGQSFAISGLLDHRLTDQLSKMPGIANIPVLGHLFRSKGITRSVVELLVVVTPTIVDPLTTTLPVVEPVNTLPYLEPKQFDKMINTPSDKRPKPAPQPQEQK
jgi:pilus assembly protein CpaC